MKAVCRFCERKFKSFGNLFNHLIEIHHIRLNRFGEEVKDE